MEKNIKFKKKEFIIKIRKIIDRPNLMELNEQQYRNVLNEFVENKRINIGIIKILQKEKLELVTWLKKLKENNQDYYIQILKELLKDAKRNYFNSKWTGKIQIQSKKVSLLLWNKILKEMLPPKEFEENIIENTIVNNMILERDIKDIVEIMIEYMNDEEKTKKEMQRRLEIMQQEIDILKDIKIKDDKKEIEITNFIKRYEEIERNNKILNESFKKNIEIIKNLIDCNVTNNAMMDDLKKRHEIMIKKINLYEKEIKKQMIWKNKFEELEQNKEKRLENMQKTMNIMEEVINEFNKYIKKDFQFKDIDQRVSRIEQNIYLGLKIKKKGDKMNGKRKEISMNENENKSEKEQNFQIEKEIINKNFFSCWSFFPVLVMNIRRLNLGNKNEDKIRLQEKIIWIFELIEKLKPLAIFLVDIGKEDNKKNKDIEWFNLNEYDKYYTGNLQNLLLIHKSVKCTIRYINENAIIMNERFIFIYWKPNDKTRWEILLNNLGKLIIIGDINFQSHNIIIEKKKKKMLEKVKDDIDENKIKSIENKAKKLYEFNHEYKSVFEEGKFKKAVGIFNIKNTYKKKKKIIEIKENMTDHKGVFIPINVLIEKDKLYEKKKNNNKFIKKRISNEYSNFVIKMIMKSEGKEEQYIEEIKKRKKYLIENERQYNRSNNIKNMIKKIKYKKQNRENNEFELIVKEINKKVKYNYNKRFKLLRNLLKYKNREDFIGMNIKENIVKEFIEITNSKLSNEKENEMSEKKRNIIEFIKNKQKEIIMILNKDEDLKKEWNNSKLYIDKSYSTALDDNFLNINLIDKIIKREIKNKINYDEFSFKSGIIEFLNWIFRIIIELIKICNLNFKTFFLDKKKNIDNLNNYRIISICPIPIKIYEQIFYKLVDDFLEEKIIKWSNNTQYGFLKGRNCDMAIDLIRKSKVNGCIIALDIKRAYEFIKLEKIEYMIKKKLKKDKERKSKEIIAMNLILIWIKLIKNCRMKLNINKIELSQGTPMGAKWSPKIFDLYMGMVFKEIIKKNRTEEKFEIIQYCDDVILKIKWGNIVKVISKIEECYNKNNMKINYEKSEILIDKDIDNYKINEIRELLNTKNKFKFEFTKNLRYLGKWLKIDKESVIKSGWDELKRIGSNIYFNKLTWDNKIQYIYAYIISKRRYLIANETNIKKIKELCKDLLKNIKFLRLSKNCNYIEILNIINYPAIWLKKILGNKEFEIISILEFNIRYISLINNIAQYKNSNFGNLLKGIKKKFNELNNKDIDRGIIENKIENLNKEIDVEKNLNDIEIIEYKNKLEEYKSLIKENINDYEIESKVILNKENYKKIAFKSKILIWELGCNLNKYIMTSFLWDNNLNKIEISGNIYSRNIYDLMNQKKIEYAICILVDIMTNISISKKIQDEKMELVCKNIIKIMKLKELQTDNEKILENLKILDKYQKENPFIELEKIPNVKKFILNLEEYRNNELISIRKDINERIDNIENKIEEFNELLIKKELKIEKEEKEKIKEELNENIDKIILDLKSEKSWSKEKVYYNLQFKWMEFCKNANENIKEEIYRAIEEELNDKEKRVNNINWNLKEKKGIKRLREICSLERKFKEVYFKNYVKHYSIINITNKKNAEMNNNLQFNPKTWQENIKNILVEREKILWKYINYAKNFNIIKKLIRCINLSLNKNYYENNIKFNYDSEISEIEIKNIFEEIYQNWKNYEDEKLILIRKEKIEKFYKQKYEKELKDIKIAKENVRLKYKWINENK